MFVFEDGVQCFQASAVELEFWARIQELESEVAHWKSNHDNQKNIKNQLMDRHDLKDRAKSIWKLHKRIAELEGKTDFPDWNQWFKDNSPPTRIKPPNNHPTHSLPQESGHSQKHVD